MIGGDQQTWSVGLDPSINLAKRYIVLSPTALCTAIKQSGHHQSSEHSHLRTLSDSSLVSQPLLQSEERVLRQSHLPPQFYTHVISGADGTSQVVEGSTSCSSVSPMETGRLFVFTWSCRIATVFLSFMTMPNFLVTRANLKIVLHGTVRICRQSCVICIGTVQHPVQWKGLNCILHNICNFMRMTSTMNGWTQKQKLHKDTQQQLQYLYYQETEIDLLYVIILMQCKTIYHMYK